MLLNYLNNLTANKKNQVALIYLSLFYFLLYFLYLVKCKYIPYIFDNNETFSSLTHAKNMALFGFKSTFGLTDETFSLSKAAHPFVYTHQGNFPRFYSYLLYLLGIQSFGWHIAITTFTVGFAGLIFCHQFISKNISILFSIIFCTLLLTDYLMFSQWQVNAWRVWQFFFFFSSFICCQKIVQDQNKWFIPITILNFACLAYTEISFAVFVTLSCFIYSFYQTNNKKNILLNTLIIGLGVGLGLTILIIQNIEFLGWQAFLTDLNYTFSSRNSISTNETKKITTFFQNHRIAFWENFNSLNNLRNPVNILKMFYRYCLLPYSPFLNFFVISTFTITVFENKSLFSKKSVLIISSIIIISILFTIVLILFKNKEYIFSHISQLKIEWTICGIISFYLFFNHLKQSYKNKSVSKLIVLASILIIIYSTLYYLNQQSLTLSNALNEFTINQFKSKYLYLASTAILILYFYYNNTLSNSIELQRFRQIYYLFVSCFIAFFAIFLILPGYIYTGYLARYCCFTVFFHILLYAWFVYSLALKVISTDFKNNNKIYKLKHLIIPSYLLIVFCVTWYNLQIMYIHEFKPNHFIFSRKLEKDPFLKNKSIVANNYPAPFTYILQSWGYYDPKIIESTLIKTKYKEEFKFTKDFKYLWFNDSKINSSYQSPDIFICWLPYYSVEQLHQSKPKCGDYNLIKLARSPNGKKYHLIEYAKDDSGEDKWSIILLKNF